VAKRFLSLVKKFGACFKAALKAWDSRMPFSSSAVIAYYTIFSLPGLLVIIINVAGYFFGKEAVTNQISEQVRGAIGPDTAQYIQNIVAKASEAKGTWISSILGIAALLFGATGVFYQVQQIFNNIWEVKPKAKQKILKLVRDRLFSFGLILVIGFVLLVSLVISAALSAVSEWVAGYLSESLLVLFGVLDFLFSMVVIAVLFAAMYKYLPDVKLPWRDVWPGALLATVLFVIAKFALGLYFGKSEPGSAYGAAGSVVLIMLWVSYTSLILLYGAEFTRVWSTMSGHQAKPAEIAESTGSN
jgi:membrane protein